jgi:hypothetical protein
MTKKEFKKLVSIHKYTGAGRQYDITAVFFDWMSGRGFKYCVNTYTRNIKQLELVNLLYDVVTKKITDPEDLPYFVQLDIAETDELRFKVPISGSGLNSLTT